MRGRFFLPQVIRGAYQHVDVTTRGVSSGPLRVERGRLAAVRRPRAVPRRARAGRPPRRDRPVEEQVTLTYADLNAYLDATGRPLRVAPGPDGGLAVRGTVNVLGQQVQAEADLELSVQEELLRLTPGRIDTGSTALDRASRLLLTQRLTLTVPLGTLPFGHQLTDIEAGPEQLDLRADGRGVVLQP